MSGLCGESGGGRSRDDVMIDCVGDVGSMLMFPVEVLMRGYYLVRGGFLRGCEEEDVVLCVSGILLYCGKVSETPRKVFDFVRLLRGLGVEHGKEKGFVGIEWSAEDFGNSGNCGNSGMCGTLSSFREVSLGEVSGVDVGGVREDGGVCPVCGGGVCDSLGDCKETGDDGLVSDCGTCVSGGSGSGLREKYGFCGEGEDDAGLCRRICGVEVFLMYGLLGRTGSVTVPEAWTSTVEFLLCVDATHMLKHVSCCIVHDSYRTELCVRYSVRVLGCASVFLGISTLAKDGTVKHAKDDWWECMKVLLSKEDVVNVISARECIIAMYFHSESGSGSISSGGSGTGSGSKRSGTGSGSGSGPSIGTKSGTGSGTGTVTCIDTWM